MNRLNGFAISILGIFLFSNLYMSRMSLTWMKILNVGLNKGDDTNFTRDHLLSPPPHMPVKPHCTFEERMEYLIKMCNKNRTTKSHPILSVLEKYRHMITNSSEKLPVAIRKKMPFGWFVVPEHRLLISMVPKTGVTSYTSMLMQYSSEFHKKHPNKTATQVYGNKIYYKRDQNGIKWIGDVSPDQLKEAFNSYYSIFTVRHPFSRLLSFYKDKIAGADCKKLMGCPDCIVKYTRNITVANRTEACSMNITFPEFIGYFKTHRNQDQNGHLKRIFLFTSPCKVRFDTFLRTETSSYDQSYIIRNFLLKNTSSFEPTVTPFKTNESSQKRNGCDVILPEFSEISDEDITWLKNFYKLDLQLFGYSVAKTALGLKAYCSVKLKDKICI